MEDLNDQIQQRLKKLDLLRGMGINPFGDRFEAADRAGALIAAHDSSTKESLEQNPVSVTLAGRITVQRRFGKAAFASVQDGVDAIQVYLKKDVLG